MFRSLLFFIGLFFITISMSLLTVATALITRSGNSAHLVGRQWARMILFSGGVKVRLEGLDNIDLSEAYVFAANHQSQFDIFALLGHLSPPFNLCVGILPASDFFEYCHAAT